MDIGNKEALEALKKFYESQEYSEPHTLEMLARTAELEESDDDEDEVASQYTQELEMDDEEWMDMQIRQRIAEKLQQRRNNQQISD